MINKQSIVPIMILPPKQIIITPPMYNNYIKKRQNIFRYARVYMRKETKKIICMHSNINFGKSL